MTVGVQIFNEGKATRLPRTSTEVNSKGTQKGIEVQRVRKFYSSFCKGRPEKKNQTTNVIFVMILRTKNQVVLHQNKNL